MSQSQHLITSDGQQSRFRGSSFVASWASPSVECLRSPAQGLPFPEELRLNQFPELLKSYLVVRPVVPGVNPDVPELVPVVAAALPPPAVPLPIP